MSNAMTSAPSSASRTACDRPCPRAAPLMTATLPSSTPMVTQLLSDPDRGLGGLLVRGAQLGEVDAQLGEVDAQVLVLVPDLLVHAVRRAVAVAGHDLVEV